MERLKNFLENELADYTIEEKITELNSIIEDTMGFFPYHSDIFNIFNEYCYDIGEISDWMVAFNDNLVSYVSNCVWYSLCFIAEVILYETKLEQKRIKNKKIKNKITC